MNTRSVAIGALAVAMSATLVAGGVPGPTTSFGLPHDPLGEAQLLPQPDGRLVVSNIGSSGKDGVSIDLGEGTGWEGVMDFGPAGALNPGTELFITCQPAGASIHLFETGGGSAGLGFLPGGMSPECVRVELYNNGQLVDTSEFDPASLPPALVVSNIGSSGQDGVRIKEIEKASPQLARVFDHEPFVFYDIILSVAQPTNINGEAPVQADQIRIVLPGEPPSGFTLNYTSSIWLAIFSFFILKERITLYTQAILIMGFIGVILLLNPSFQGGQEFAALISLAGGAMSGWAYLQVRELSLLGEPGWRVVFYLSLTGLIMGAVWSTITGWHPLTVSSLPYLAGIGISAMIAQLAMTRAYKVGKKFTVASLSYLTVVFSALSGVLLFGDKITWQEAAGMVIIVAGGVFSSFTPASIKKFLMKQ